MGARTCRAAPGVRRAVIPCGSCRATGSSWPKMLDRPIASGSANAQNTWATVAGSQTARAPTWRSVDTATSTSAVWDPATVTQVFCAFAEPDAIGLSSILGQLAPVSRREPRGVAARLSADAARRVLAPIAPGLVVPVGVADISWMQPGTGHAIEARAGVIAVDGERELTFGPGEVPVVTLREDGPRCVDVPAVLAASARLGLLRR